jgi:hypothetical protein
MIHDDKIYLIEGSALKMLRETVTKINEMSGQQLAGKGDELRDLAQRAHLCIDDAEHTRREAAWKLL